jgi:hypothetical protein
VERCLACEADAVGTVGGSLRDRPKSCHRNRHPLALLCDLTVDDHQKIRHLCELAKQSGRTIQVPNDLLCSRRPHKRGSAPRVAAPVGLASEAALHGWRPPVGLASEAALHGSTDSCKKNTAPRIRWIRRAAVPPRTIRKNLRCYTGPDFRYFK